ncbi:hypothetical protein LTR94_036938, partial [Friedmanniomyces endolithicus]
RCVGDPDRRWSVDRSIGRCRTRVQGWQQRHAERAQQSGDRAPDRHRRCHRHDPRRDGQAVRRERQCRQRPGVDRCARGPRRLATG